jgi:hypothetical protein
LNSLLTQLAQLGSSEGALHGVGLEFNKPEYADIKSDNDYFGDRLRCLQFYQPLLHNANAK